MDWETIENSGFSNTLVEGMREEIKLEKRSKQERLAIANTLIDSVTQEISNKVIIDYLSHCMEVITSCMEFVADESR